MGEWAGPCFIWPPAEHGLGESGSPLMPRRQLWPVGRVWVHLVVPSDSTRLQRSPRHHPRPSELGLPMWNLGLVAKQQEAPKS